MLKQEKNVDYDPEDQFKQKEEPVWISNPTFDGLDQLLEGFKTSLENLKKIYEIQKRELECQRHNGKQ